MGGEGRAAVAAAAFGRIGHAALAQLHHLLPASASSDPPLSAPHPPCCRSDHFKLKSFMAVEEVPSAVLQVRIQGIPVYHKERTRQAGRQAPVPLALELTAPRRRPPPPPARRLSSGHAGLAAACRKGGAHRISPGRLDPGVRGACAVVVGRVQAD